MRIKRLRGVGGVSATSRMAVVGLTILLAGLCGSIATMAQTETPGVPSVDAPSAPPARPIGPVRVSSGVVARMQLDKPAPIYPEEARAAGVQGTVILHAIISKTGTIEDLSVISGPELLQAAAADAVRRWTYRPYLLNGEPVEVETSITVNFTFGGPKPAVPPPPEINMLRETFTPDAGEQTTVPQGPIRISSGVVAGMALSKPAPIYPKDAKALGVQGAVRMRAIISKTGMIEDLQVISGQPLLRTAAMDAVRQWTYRPYILNGEPAEVETNITVNFVLDKPKPAAPQSPEIDMLHDGPPPAMPSPARQETAGVVAKQVGGGITPPVLIHQVEADYSPEAIQTGIEGVVTVSCIVDEYGMPQNVHVVRGVGYGLDKNAVESVKKYRFKPAMMEGKPVAVYLNVEVNFRR